MATESTSNCDLEAPIQNLQVFPSRACKWKIELTESATSVCLLQQKTETVNFRLFAENGKTENEIRKFVFLGRQMMNGNR
jgi:hypothetical protein